MTWKRTACRSTTSARRSLSEDKLGAVPKTALTARGFDWDDLGQLLRRTISIDRNRITADCVRGFGCLAYLTDDERMLTHDPHQREQALWERLSAVG